MVTAQTNNSTSPVAASGTTTGAMPSTAGSTRPAAASNSTAPMALRAPGLKSSTQRVAAPPAAASRSLGTNILALPIRQTVAIRPATIQSARFIIGSLNGGGGLLSPALPGTRQHPAPVTSPPRPVTSPPFERQALWSTQGGPRHVTGRRAVSSQGLQPPTNPRENTMDARLNYFADPTAARALRHLMPAGRTVQESSLPATTQQLVALRVSQINGCAVCVDMHTKEAAAAGETAVRLHLVAVWREAGVFTEAERAALELAEQGTRVADAGEGVSDEVWTRAAVHYDQEQLTALVFLVAFMNTANRLNIIARQPA